ncbi:hypothetical protein G6011_08553 [Alternaria panax]|uniref:BTB domain-containing protein n=1 Tax=Alternaria panax TaxID=48097 RepID=A0AAD4FI87_9PLEO|nr:hypothetical protein G6011_08553 [Alternaria panax]
MFSRNHQQCEQKRPRISARNALFAKVVISSKAQSFTVHLDLLIYYSPFFRAALTGSFKEAGEKLVTLSDADTDTFELFVHWLYHQRLPTEVDSPELFALYRGRENEDTVPALQMEMLIKLYVFCDKHNVPQLYRQCLDTMFQVLDDGDVLSDCYHPFFW